MTPYASAAAAVNDDGDPVALDDVPPRMRAFTLLFLHAYFERDAGRPLPCRCGECQQNRVLVRQ